MMYDAPFFVQFKKIVASAGIGFFMLLLGFLLPSSVLAQSTVTPYEATIKTVQTFTIGITNDAQLPVIAVTVLVPGVLSSIAPVQQQGWNITSSAATTEQAGSAITWSGGNIESGLRAEFHIHAQLPEAAGELPWTISRTLSDGTKLPAEVGSENVSTKAVYELQNTSDVKAAQRAAIESRQPGDRAQFLAIIALTVSFAGFLLAQKKRK